MTAPLRVGILNDMSDGPPGSGRNIEQWLRLAVDEVTARGRIDREVEFVHAWGLGLPSGTAAAVERAFAELADQDVLLITGPAMATTRSLPRPSQSATGFQPSTGPGPSAVAATTCSTSRWALTKTNQSSSPGTSPGWVRNGSALSTTARLSGAATSSSCRRKPMYSAFGSPHRRASHRSLRTPTSKPGSFSTSASTPSSTWVLDSPPLRWPGPLPHDSGEDLGP